MEMFCYQCEETVNGKGCSVQGVCGKTAEVSHLQDVLIYLAKGISCFAVKAKELGLRDEEASVFVMESLFSTVTNVNFDSERIISLINKAFKIRSRVKSTFLGAYKEKYKMDFQEPLPDAACWEREGHYEQLLPNAKETGVLSQKDEDIRSLRELIVYGLKGLAAYADHAYVLGFKDESIFDFIEEALTATLDDSLKTEELLSFVIRTGEHSVKAMKLLDSANTSFYGNPEITEVFTGTKKGPGILVSGHDLKDLEEILKQSEGHGVNVYTHGEMLPSLAYPALKKFKQFVGHYGTSWWNQQKEFDSFNGAIVMTTNCLQKPKPSYKDRIFTTGLVAWPGVRHIENREKEGAKDFSPVIEKALSLGGLEEKQGKTLTIGFAHHAVLAMADKVIEAVRQGKIKKFVVMSGCDGRHKEREHFTEAAEKLPKDHVILTSGCAKFRYNMLDLGDIDGIIPRILDAGQCNDSYSWAVVALKLKEVFGAKDINELPISFDIAWYEQKAVCVLLALLYLGFKDIKLGPVLPAFLSPNVLKILVEKFRIEKTDIPEKDTPGSSSQDKTKFTNS
ncbi:MAG: hydroxylamine reductase [Candidatus Aureabacteria bacterium]|nr:hydroxylamine reductase [Candidatus Auribacterota bacterium]